MNTYIYLVHAEIIKDLSNNIEDAEEYLIAFSSSKKAENYIKEEAEWFDNEHDDSDAAPITYKKEPGYFMAVYMNGAKVERLKLWYEQVALAE